MDMLALLGHPVSHSVSPAMHNAAASELGLNYQYVAQDIAPELLADAITYLRTGKWIGANVTIPYKKAVIPLIDELGDTAKALGAVNTLVRVGERIRGENTDVEGFLIEIDSLEVDLTGRPALIFGTMNLHRLYHRRNPVRLLPSHSHRVCNPQSTSHPVWKDWGRRLELLSYRLSQRLHWVGEAY